MDDELADLIVPHLSADSGPVPGLSMSGGAMHFGQGVVLEWNNQTGENLIAYRGKPLRNLPIIGGTDIFVIQPGDLVEIRSSSPTGGAGVYWIGGRLVVPGTDAAQRSIDFMRSSLVSSIIDDLVDELLRSESGQELAAWVLGQRIHTGYNADFGTRSSTSYGDLSGTETGPSVTADVSSSGRAMVWLAATNQMFLGGAIGNETHFSGLASFTVSGATSVAAADSRSIRATIDGNPETNSGTETITQSRPVILTGLNEGTHTFTMRYRQWEGATGSTTRVQIGERTIAVFAF